MKIELEIQTDSPLCIAEALIRREAERCKEEYMVIVTRENIRQMGLALVNHAESCDRCDKWMERSK